MTTSKNEDVVGVQQLIDRLKTDGVEEGKQQAEAVLAEAKRHAASLIEEAREQANAIRHEAQNDATRIEANGKQALTLASRDTSLRLKEQLEREFRGWIGVLVKEPLAAPEFLTTLLREMAVHAGGALAEPNSEPTAPDQNKLSVLTSPEHASSLEKFVRGQTAAMFRGGVEVRPDASVNHGFRMKMQGSEVEIDFTERAVTAALMRYLAPKFRQLIGAESDESAGG